MTKFRKSQLVATLAMVVTSLFTGCTSSNLEEAKCRFSVPARTNIECGYLTVPEDRNSKNSPMIRLHFAIVHSVNEDPAPDPVVILHGGPGGYALDSMDLWLYLFSITIRDRDLIILDQRGTGYSQPSLNCPEAEEQWYQSWGHNTPTAIDNQNYLQALLSCRDRLIKEGIDLNAYTSAANAADVDDLRQALGYSEWNLYGSSYGTRLALTIIRDHPDGVRSVVLDSVYPPQVDLTTTQTVSFERSLDLLFAACTADLSCNEKYPDLKTTFYGLAEQLDKEPVKFQLIRPSNSMFYDVILNGDRFIWTTRQLLYLTDQIPVVPARITALQEGETASLAEQMKWFIFFDDFWSEGMFYSIHCAEDVPSSTEQDAQRLNDTVNPRLIQAIDPSKFFYPLCSAWNTNQPTAIENEPIISDIPTLILSGEFDPVTPPAWGQLTAETLSNSQFLEFPGFGHGILGSGPDTGNCSKQIVNAFISNPDATVDASCIDSLERPFNP